MNITDNQRVLAYPRDHQDDMVALLTQLLEMESPTKAFLCTLMAPLVAEEGLDLDVVSGGELHVYNFYEFQITQAIFLRRKK